MEGEVCHDGHFLHDTSSSSTVVDGKLITSQGPGSAFDFALRIVKELVGVEASSSVSKDCLLTE
jgi:putative intracellular protease/amidase